MNELLENLKGYKQKLKEDEVIQLSEFKGNLEAEITRYLVQKEKKDRVGKILTQVMFNTSC